MANQISEESFSDEPSWKLHQLWFARALGYPVVMAANLPDLAFAPCTSWSQTTLVKGEPSHHDLCIYCLLAVQPVPAALTSYIALLREHCSWLWQYTAGVLGDLEFLLLVTGFGSGCPLWKSLFIDISLFLSACSSEDGHFHLLLSPALETLLLVFMDTEQVLPRSGRLGCGGCFCPCS